MDVGVAATERLEAELVSWSARLAAATASWLAVLAEYDRRRGWEGWGCRSAAQWLSWHCGIGPRSAREHLRVAHALEALPAVRAAMASGELSFSRVRAVTRVAEPATEAVWLELARASTAAQLERAVQGVRRATRAGDPAVAHAQRSVRWWWDDDGTFVLRARLPADAGRVVVAALEAAVAGEPSPEPGADEPVDARRADALVALAAGAGPPSVDLVVHTSSAGLRGSARPGAEEAAAVLHCGPAAVAGGVLHGGPAVAPEVARRLACDASVRQAGADGRWSRRTRLVRGRLRRRLFDRDGGCRWPGCASRSHLHAHHVQHWARGGATRLDNLVLLCGAHHRLVYDGGYQLRLDEGVVRVRRPDGVPLERIEGGPAGPLPGAAVPPARAWDGGPLHLADVVEGVFLAAAEAPP